LHAETGVGNRAEPKRIYQPAAFHAPAILSPLHSLQRGVKLREQMLLLTRFGVSVILYSSFGSLFDQCGTVRLDCSLLSFRDNGIPGFLQIIKHLIPQGDDEPPELPKVLRIISLGPLTASRVSSLKPGDGGRRSSHLFSSYNFLLVQLKVFRFPSSRDLRAMVFVQYMVNSPSCAEGNLYGTW
jgi:hypothetical protein